MSEEKKKAEAEKTKDIKDMRWAIEAERNESGAWKTRGRGW